MACAGSEGFALVLFGREQRFIPVAAWLDLGEQASAPRLRARRVCSLKGAVKGCDFAVANAVTQGPRRHGPGVLTRSRAGRGRARRRGGRFLGHRARSPLRRGRRCDRCLPSADEVGAPGAAQDVRARGAEPDARRPRGRQPPGSVADRGRRPSSPQRGGGACGASIAGDEGRRMRPGPGAGSGGTAIGGRGPGTTRRAAGRSRRRGTTGAVRGWPLSW